MQLGYRLSVHYQYKWSFLHKVMDKTLLHVDNAYKIPNIRATGHLCRTNTPSNTAFRGFGAPQAILTCEHIITEIIHKLKLSPIKVWCFNMINDHAVLYAQSKIFLEQFYSVVTSAVYRCSLSAIVQLLLSSRIVSFITC